MTWAVPVRQVQLQHQIFFAESPFQVCSCCNFVDTMKASHHSAKPGVTTLTSFQKEERDVSILSWNWPASQAE